MKFTLGWLTDYLETDRTLSEITHGLTMLGLELESINTRDELDGFMACEVLRTDKHPDSDKLSLCHVDVGDGKTRDLVCGAPNVRPGLKTIFADLGQTIPANGMVLKAATIRGVESCGMLCSAGELNINEEDSHAGIMELPKTAIAGQPIKDVLGLNDPVIDIAVTPNRGDCLGVWGIARDLAAAGFGTLKPMIPQAYADEITAAPVKTDLVNLTPISTPDQALICPQFAALSMNGINPQAPTPALIKQRLQLVGVRPISIIVDLTNYIMLDWGRPLHAFDAAKLTGPLQVRYAKNGETLTALDHKTHTLTDNHVVVADNHKPQSLAGIMGGEDSGVNTDNTHSVILESALFDPIATAQTGRELKTLSDSRFRFERGVDTDIIITALHRLAHMILTHCGGKITGFQHTILQEPIQKTISLDYDLVQKRTGLSLTVNQINNYLTQLGLACLSQDPQDTSSGTLVGLYAIPTWRHDLTIPEDLVEDILRLHGYDSLPCLPLPAPVTKADDKHDVSVFMGSVITDRYKRQLAMRKHLAGAQSLTEVLSYTFTSSALGRLFYNGDITKDLAIANPIKDDLNVMRPTLIINLLSATADNINHGQKQVGLFEVGPIFSSLTPGDQQDSAAGVRTGAPPAHWSGSSNTNIVFAVKDDALSLLTQQGLKANAITVDATKAPAYYHPGRSGALCLGPKTVLGYFGELHPSVLKSLKIKQRVAVFEIFTNALPSQKKKSSPAKPLLTVPTLLPIYKQASFLVDQNLWAQSVVQAVQKADRQIIQDVTVFDIYDGNELPENTKAVGVSFWLHPQGQTFTEEDIAKAFEKIAASVHKHTGGTLRDA
jgi:phenylalanyl-tRNA synthetase beta chain